MTQYLSKLSAICFFMLSLAMVNNVIADEKEADDDLQYYLMIGTPTSETWAGLVKNEVDMGPGGKAGIEAMGGKFIGFYIATGEFKNYAIVAFPKNTDVARIVFTRAMQGVMDDIKFIPMMTTTQAQKVFKEINKTKIGGNA